MPLLNQKRFTSLKGIRCTATSETGQGYLLTFPDLRLFEAVDGLVGPLNEISRQQAEDILPSTDLSVTDYDSLQRYVWRETGRIGSFIIFGLSLSKVLERQHQDFIAHFKTLIGCQISDAPNSTALRPYRDYRNKVFAHISFGEPKHKGKVDNLSAQLTSLLYASGKGFCIQEGRLTLGVVTESFEGSKEEVALPKINFQQAHKDFGTYFSSWYVLWTEYTKKIQAIKDDQFKNWFSKTYSNLRVLELSNNDW
jgi:hypothetical protein